MTFRDRVKEFRRVPASALIPNEKNWRRHPERQQKAIRAVLAEVGFAGALLAREDAEGKIILIDGHLRADIAATEQVPVLILDVDEQEADKILATFDPLAGMAQLDMEAFGKLAGTIKFDTADFGSLIQDLNPTKSVEGEDETPNVPASPISQIGDLWLLGRHRLLCGDSTKTEDVTRVMDGKRASLFATDPPYLVDYDGMAHPSKIGVKEPKSKNKDWTDSYHEWDSSKGDGRQFYLDFCRVAIDVAVTKNAAWYCWHS